MTYPKGYNPPGAPTSSGGSSHGSYPKPKRRRGVIAAIIIIVFLFIIGIGAYSSTKPSTTYTSSNLEMSTNLETSTNPDTSSNPEIFSDEDTSPSSSGSNCDSSYPDFCIPSPPPDLNCGDISQKRFTVSGSDPHGFDRDGDGVGCES